MKQKRVLAFAPLLPQTRKVWRVSSAHANLRSTRDEKAGPRSIFKPEQQPETASSSAPATQPWNSSPERTSQPPVHVASTRTSSPSSRPHHETCRPSSLEGISTRGRSSSSAASPPPLGWRTATRLNWEAGRGRLSRREMCVRRRRVGRVGRTARVAGSEEMLDVMRRSACVRSSAWCDGCEGAREDGTNE